MNVVIVGMGEVGRHIVQVLTHEGHNVIAVDASDEAIARTEEMFDVMTLKGHGASTEVMRRAHPESCDLFVAVTNQSEVNLIAALRARQAGATRTIARADDPAYFDDDRGLVTDFLGIDLVINPSALVALEIHKIARSVSALSVEDFADNRIEVIQLPVNRDTKSLGKPLKSLSMPKGTLVVAIVRDGELIVPGGNDAIHIGDELYVVGMTDQMAQVERVFGRRRRQVTRKVIIVGGGIIGHTLARTLENDGVNVVLIERNRKRCDHLAESLSRTTIINGDGTDIHLLEEEGVENADLFVAAAMEDEVNLMAALLAKELGAKRCVALIHKPDYTSVCERLGIDITISPRLAVAKQVLKYVRAGEVLSVSRIMDGEGEFLEFLVPPDARITHQALKDVNFPRGAVVCAGLGRQGTFVPRGDDRLEAGDRVVVFLTPKVRPDVVRLFRKSGFSLR